MWDEMYDMAISSFSELGSVCREAVEFHYDRMMRLSMSEEIIDKDERRMLASSKSTVKIDNGTRESMAFFDARALGRRWGVVMG
jgi:hypothetical protein